VVQGGRPPIFGKRNIYGVGDLACQVVEVQRRDQADAGGVTPGRHDGEVRMRKWRKIGYSV